MGKMYERALLLCPKQYSLSNSLKSILSIIAEEVKNEDVRSAIGWMDTKLNSQMFRLPHAVRSRWERHFQSRVNGRVQDLLTSYSPDLVLIYNSQYLIPETCKAIRKRSKLVFFMGDSPFYTPQNSFYLSCLPYADLILSPDTFWESQLNTMGLHNTLYFIPGVDENSYFRIIDQERNEEKTDILYVGSCYLNSWGYKKALLMNAFSGLNFRLYGNSAWRRWFSFFPALETVYTESVFVPQERLNRMYNHTRIIPVDGNPGIINGVHLRMFEALAAGALPLIEYRKDVDTRLFNGFSGELPVIRDYRTAEGLASRYLKNDTEREQLVSVMNTFISKEYSHEANADRLTKALR